LSITYCLRLAIRSGFQIPRQGVLQRRSNTVAQRLASLMSRAYLSFEPRRNVMAQEPLATKGNYLHIYDFRVEKGKEAEFIELFESFDYSDGNPMHKSSAQVKDGVLCRDTEDPQRFFLIAEWSDIEEHARIRKVLANEIKPEFIKYIEGHKFIPKYVEVVSSTPDEILKKAAAE
jgi:hypothetical protein